MKELKEWIKSILIAIILALIIRSLVMESFIVDGNSMLPTLTNTEWVLVNKFVYTRPQGKLEAFLLPAKKLDRQDIVVFKWPRDLSKDFVKRVIALEGEKVEIKDKEVFVNDRPLEERYKVHNDSQIFQKGNFYQYDDVIRDNYGPVVVPPGHVFVMGDNRDNSLDSRYWSFLPTSYIKGRPWLIYFSYQAEKDAYQKNGIKDKVRKFFRFIFKTRWKRMLKVIF